MIIRGGWIVDGSGRKPYLGDVAIYRSKIVKVGLLSGDDSMATIDAKGLTVLPGFVDPHSHSDYTVHSNPLAQSTVRQGVTTEVVGNCGMTYAPVSDSSRPGVVRRLRDFGYEGDAEWTSFGDYLATVERTRTSQNLAWLVGHNSLREAVGLRAEPPSEAQVIEMDRLLSDAMEAGALGMSTGLELGGGRFATTGEITRLAQVVGRHHGYYVSHIRNRDACILEAIDEFLSIVVASETRGQISHLNVRSRSGAAPNAWAAAVGRVEKAVAMGLDVQADTTPMTWGDGDMSAILPDWLMADGPSRAAEKLAQPAIREQLRSDCDRYWRFIHSGQWERVRLLNSAQFQEYNGMTFPEIAAARGTDEWDTYFDILEAAGEGLDNVAMVGELFTEEHLADMIRHPLFSLGADTYTSTADLPLSRLTPTPLAYSAHVHYLTHHVAAQKTLPLEEAVRKMTSKPAERFGILDRGLIKSGYYADLVVLDIDQLGSASTLEAPAVYPTGVQWVLVNGEVVVDPTGHTGARPGRVLRRGI